MNPQDLAAARRKAQEAREDVGAFGMPRHTTHDLADLVDALVGEVEEKSRRVDELEDLARRMFSVLDHYGYLHSVEPEQDHDAFWAEYHRKMGEG